MRLWNTGTALALIAGVVAFFGIESYFRERLVPYPSLPFRIVGGVVVYCVIQCTFSLADLLQGIRKARAGRSGKTPRVRGFRKR